MSNFIKAAQQAELLIARERLAQVRKWGIQNHSHQDWMMILMEEVGEFANAEMEHRYRNAPKERIKEELVQVCSVARAMLENLLRREAEGK